MDRRKLSVSAARAPRDAGWRAPCEPVGMSDFERIGGERALRAIISDFVGRCYSDIMIGYLFRRADRERIERFEYELMADHLGGGVAYAGRPLAEAHGKHGILGGQFDRRWRLLDETLVAHGVPTDVRERIRQWQEALRPLVTMDRDGKGCLPPEHGGERA